MPPTTEHNPFATPPDARSRLQRLYVADAGVFLSQVTLDPIIRRELDTHGYGVDEIAAGLALAKSAGEVVEKHPEGLGVRDELDDRLFADAEAARDEFERFREVTRGALPTPADRETLGVAADVPEDFDAFFTAAVAAYRRAGEAPFVDKLTARGYTGPRLAKLLAALQKLGGPAGANLAPHEDVVKLGEYMREIKAVTRGALRDQPGLLAKLALVKEKVKPELRVDVGVNPQQ